MKVTHKGKTYDTQNENAFLSNRVFSGSWNDAKTGDDYVSEWYQPAVDSNGERVLLVYQFPAICGEEPEDDGWDWHDDSNVVEVRER